MPRLRSLSFTLHCHVDVPETAAEAGAEGRRALLSGGIKDALMAALSGDATQAKEIEAAPEEAKSDESIVTVTSAVSEVFEMITCVFLVVYWRRRGDGLKRKRFARELDGSQTLAEALKTAVDGKHSPASVANARYYISDSNWKSQNEVHLAKAAELGLQSLATRSRLFVIVDLLLPAPPLLSRSPSRPSSRPSRSPLSGRVIGN